MTLHVEYEDGIYHEPLSSACERANARIKELDRMVDEADRDIDKLESELAKCEQQKRGLAAAAKRGMAAGGRIAELADLIVAKERANDTLVKERRLYRKPDAAIEALRADRDEWKEAARRWREDKTDEEARLARLLERAEAEAARLITLLVECCPHDSVNGDVCAACGLHVTWIDDGDHMGHFELAIHDEGKDG